MIPEPFIHRFKGDTGIDIARQEIDAVFPDGERRRVVLRLGAPFPRDDDYWIRTELENLDHTDGPIAGGGQMHTLVLGLAWIPARLRVFTEKHGCRYFYPDSDSSFDPDDFFRPLRSRTDRA